MIDAEGRIRKQVAVGQGPSALAVGAGSVWAANSIDGTVSRLDRDGRETPIPVDGDPAGLAFGAGSLWVTNRRDRSVSQISPGANRVVRSFAAGNSPRAVAVAFGVLWVASEVDRTITRIDLAGNAQRDEVDLRTNPTALAASARALWAASEEGRAVFRIDPRSRRVVDTIPVGNGPVAVAVGAGAVWVANRQDATVSRIDPATDAVAYKVTVGPDPSAIAAGADAVCVASSGDGTVTRIDPRTRRASAPIHVGSTPTALALAGGRLWTAAVPSPAAHRGGTLVVEQWPFDCKCLDPGSYGEGNDLLALAYDGLVSYPRIGGSTHGALVGDLATDVPEPSSDGLTYVFRLRPGIRYANGATVQPADFRASLESLMRRHPELPSFYDHLAGARACRPKRCDLSKGIETDAAARTITLHLTSPDPDLLHKLAFPFAYVVPADHPFGPRIPPPGTGAYRFASFDPKREARLVRNPHFRVWSRDARPDGLADQIVVRLRDDVDAQVAAVQRGASDVVYIEGPFGGPVPPARIPAIAAQSGGRLYTAAIPELDYMFMNVQVPPFDDVRVRQAVNYAADRTRLAELAGCPDIAQPTCQVVFTGFTTYAPSCRYTLNPGGARGWTAPDLARARRLVDRSGTRGMRIEVWGYRERRPLAAYFVSLLHRLGYRASLHYVEKFGDYAAAILDSRQRPQMGIVGWGADYAAPSTAVALYLCDSGDLSHFCDRGLQPRIDEAIAARGPEANRLWQGVYRRIENAAPIVPLFNRRTMVLVSKRVGNYQHHPLFGPLYDQMWVQ